MLFVLIAVSALGNISFGQIWLDIEVRCFRCTMIYSQVGDLLQGSQYWLGNENANRNFFEELLSAAKVSTLCFVVCLFFNCGIIIIISLPIKGMFLRCAYTESCAIVDYSVQLFYLYTKQDCACCAV